MQIMGKRKEIQDCGASQYKDTLPKEIAFLREDAKYKHDSHLLEPYTASKKLHAYLHSNNIIRQGQHCKQV